MKRNSRTIVGVFLGGLLILLFVSCSDDGGGTHPCINCSYWSPAYGGVGRFPAASPDPEVVAFSSNYVFPSQLEAPVDRDSLDVNDSYDLWIARTEAISDTVWYYRVTDGSDDDFVSAWSPDGNTIAFERNMGSDNERQVFVVDVSDPENPGTPVQVTQRTNTTYSSTTPSWAVVGGDTWISVATGPRGGGDIDIVLHRYPGLDSLAWISVDPSDFAQDEGGVMSYVFDDQRPSGNGTGLVAFASPNRLPVGDLLVLASSEEQPDSTVVAPIFVNGKESNQETPYIFRYRPAGIQVTLSGILPDYCSPAAVETAPVADTLTTFVLDFVHTHGAFGIRSVPGGRDVYMDGQQLFTWDGVAVRTFPAESGEYVYVSCVIADSVFTIDVKSVFGTPCGDAVEMQVAAGETTFVTFTCEGAIGSGPMASRSRIGRGAASHLTSQQPSREILTQGEDARSIWLLDLGADVDVEDDQLYVVEARSPGSNAPVLSPDGKYMAYFRGEYTSWEIVIADVSGLLAGSEGAELTRVGLPGSAEDIECWRKPESISWLPTAAGRKIVVSLSPCRGGEPDDYSMYIADLSGHLPH